MSDATQLPADQNPNTTPVATGPQAQAAQASPNQQAPAGPGTGNTFRLGRNWKFLLWWIIPILLIVLASIALDFYAFAVPLAVVWSLLIGIVWLFGYLWNGKPENRTFLLVWLIPILLFWAAAISLSLFPLPGDLLYSVYGPLDYSYNPQYSDVPVWLRDLLFISKPIIDESLMIQSRGILNPLMSKWVVLWSALIGSLWLLTYLIASEKDRGQNRSNRTFFLRWIVPILLFGLASLILRILIPSSELGGYSSPYELPYESGGYPSPYEPVAYSPIYGPDVYPPSYGPDGYRIYPEGTLSQVEPSFVFGPLLDETRQIAQGGMLDLFTSKWVILWSIIVGSWWLLDWGKERTKEAREKREARETRQAREKREASETSEAREKRETSEREIEVTRQRIRFFLAWILGFVALIWVIKPILTALAPSLVTPESSLVAKLDILLVIWTMIVILIYFLKGDSSAPHAQYIVPYRGIWASFLIVLLITILTGYAVFQSVTERVSGDLSTKTLAFDTIEHMEDLSNRTYLTVLTVVGRGSEPCLQVNSPGYAYGIEDSLTIQVTQISQCIPAIQEQLANTRVTAVSAHTQLGHALDSNSAGKEALIQLRNVVSQAVLYADELTTSAFVPISNLADTVTKEDLVRTQRRIDLEQGMDELYSLQVFASTLLSMIVESPAEVTAEAIQELEDRIQALEARISKLDEVAQTPTPVPAEAIEASEKITELEARIQALEVRISNLYDGDAVASALVVTETARVAQIKTMVRDQILGPVESISKAAAIASRSAQGIGFGGLAIFLWMGILFSVFVLFPWALLLMFIFRKQRNRAVQIFKDLRRLDPNHDLLKKAVGATYFRKPGATYTLDEQDTKHNALVSEIDNLPPLESTASGWLAPNRAVNDKLIVDALTAQAFSNFEYVLGLLLLTLVTAAGWYYLFYPQASYGLALQIEQNSGIQELTKHLISNISPLTLGFAGAYFFLMQMLLRRYLADDLYPSSYLQAAARLIVVFILSLLFGFLFGTSDAWWVGTAAALAFFAGIYPRSGWSIAARSVNALVEKLDKRGRSPFPENVETAPLTTLDGINIWTEARLLEENVENVQSLSTAPIEQLVLGTHYPTLQLVDWIDQAILYTHAGHQGEWFPHLRSVGIRTATDLLDALGYDLCKPPETQQCEFEPPQFDVLNKRLVAAIHAAYLSPAAGSAASIATFRQWNSTLTKQTNKMMSRTSKLKRLVQSIEPDKRESYDYVAALKANIAAALARSRAVVAPLAGLTVTFEQITNADARSQATEYATDLSSILTEVVTLAGEAVNTTEPMSLDVKTLDTLGQAREQLNSWHTRLIHADNRAKDLEQFIREGLTSEATDLVNVLLEKLTAVREALTQALSAARDASNSARDLDPKRPQTLNALRSLKDDLVDMQETTDKLRKGQVTAKDAIEEMTKNETNRLALDLNTTDVTGVLDDLARDIRFAVSNLDVLQADMLDSDQLSADALAATNKAIEGVDKVVKATQDVAATLASSFDELSSPTPIITEEIIYQIWDSISPDPNIQYILCFYYFSQVSTATRTQTTEALDTQNKATQAQDIQTKATEVVRPAQGYKTIEPKTTEPKTTGDQNQSTETKTME